MLHSGLLVSHARRVREVAIELPAGWEAKSKKGGILFSCSNDAAVILGSGSRYPMRYGMRSLFGIVISPGSRQRRTRSPRSWPGRSTWRRRNGSCRGASTGPSCPSPNCAFPDASGRRPRSHRHAWTGSRNPVWPPTFSRPATSRYVPPHRSTWHKEGTNVAQRGRYSRPETEAQRTDRAHVSKRVRGPRAA